MQPAFRLFVSSTFVDMRRERDLLQRKVFPSIVDFARSFGADFRVVDFAGEYLTRRHTGTRWPRCAWAEVDRALENDVEPRLLCLLGQRHGWRPLPPWILPLHVERLERVAAAPCAESAAVDEAAIELIRSWYSLDENAVPPHLALRSAHDIPHQSGPSSSQAARGARCDRQGRRMARSERPVAH